MVVSSEVVVALITAVLGPTGLFTVWKVWADRRDQRASREEDADERTVLRLEREVVRKDDRIVELEALLLGKELLLSRSQREVARLMLLCAVSGVNPERE